MRSAEQECRSIECSRNRNSPMVREKGEKSLKSEFLADGPGICLQGKIIYIVF